MEIRFKISIPLVAEDPVSFERGERFLAEWQERRWAEGQFAPSEFLILRVTRSGQPRDHIPSQTLSEQWRVMVCEGAEEVIVNEVRELEQSLKDLARCMQERLGLEEPAVIYIGEHKHQYHRLHEERG